MSNKAEDKTMKPAEKRALVPKLRFPEFRDAGEWEVEKLIDVLSPEMREVAKPSSNYLGLGLRSHGKGTFKKPNQAPEKNAMDRLYLVHRDDLIVNITFAWEGAIAIADDSDHGSYVSHRFPTYMFKSLASTPAFFRYVITRKAFVYNLGLISPGGAGRNRVMNKNDFLKITVLLPSSTEQQKIADCLSSIDELVTLETQKLDTLKAHKKGLMQQLFPAEGETQPRFRFPEFQNAGEWEEKRLEDLAKRASGHTPSKSKPEYYNGGIKWVSLADSKRLDKGLISETTIEISEQGIKNSSAVLHPAGSVILSRDAGVGKSAVMSESMAVSQHFIVWTCDKGRLSNWFLYYVLQIKKPIFESVASGSTIKTIGLPFFKEMRITVPQVPEQQCIADSLSSIDDLIIAQTQKLDTLKAHKKGLMQQLFPALELVQG